MNAVVGQVFEYGLNALNASNYSKAEEHFTAILNQTHDWWCLWYLAAACCGSGKTNTARNLYTYIMEKCPAKSLRKLAVRALVIVSMSDDAPSDKALSILDLSS